MGSVGRWESARGLGIGTDVVEGQAGPVSVVSLSFMASVGLGEDSSGETLKGLKQKKYVKLAFKKKSDIFFHADTQYTPT